MRQKITYIDHVENGWISYTFLKKSSSKIKPVVKAVKKAILGEIQ